jgi:short-subunit dehydrogenase
MTNTGVVSARPVALITGASAGIGAEFAARLAGLQYDLVLVARRRDRLEAIAAAQRAAHGIRVEVIEADLSLAGAPDAIVAGVARAGMTVDLLVNNAGFGTHGRFETIPPERERDEIAVNVTALVALTRAFLPAMLERGRGGVINVASTAAFQPVPYMAVYGATKAFVRSFSEALHEEVRDRGVRVLALCPGVTATEFFDVDAGAAHGPIRTTRDVVTTALKSYDAGSPIVIALSRLLPDSVIMRITGRLMKP